jgi:formamidopyrimidine-DNA glycosylase
MPELPEVEAVRLQLAKFVVGSRIGEIEILTPKYEVGMDKKKVVGARVVNVRRFGKILSIDLSNGFSIIIHLKLTGQLIYRGPNLKNPPPLSSRVAEGLPGKYTHIIFKLDRGGALYFNDLRQFGWMKIVQSSELKFQSDFLTKLGYEPPVVLDSPLPVLTLEEFGKILAGTKRAIKIVLMDQTKIAGVGNIYANDALWLAEINPLRPANRLTSKEVELLFKSIIKVLKNGIKMGGSSENTFVVPDGSEGKYQNFTLVYGREGLPCKRCGEKIRKISLGGRGTYFCPNCQK